MCNTSRGRGFSLTELLVVVAVILILVSVLIVSTQAIYGQAMQLKCQHRLEQIGHALQMYSTKHQGMMPKSWDQFSGRFWHQALAATYLDDPTMLACPSVGVPPTIGQPGQAIGVSRDTVEAYKKVLNWLKNEQDASGAFPVSDPDASWWAYPNAMTGFALMALFGYGCNDRHPPEFAETVRKAVEHLAGPAQIKTGANAGLITDRGMLPGESYSKCAYVHGIGLMALAAAVRTCEDPELRRKARDAAAIGIQWVGSQQPWHGCFNYSGGAVTGKADSSGTGWVYQGVGACRVAGVPVSSEVMAKAQVFLDHMAAANGKMGYRWYPPPEGPSTADWLDERHTAIGLCVRLLLGESPSSAIVQNQVNYITGDKSGIPRHIYNFTHPDGQYQLPGDGTDRYQFYHTTRGLRIIGGDVWATWHDGDTSIVAHGEPFEGYPKYVLKHLIDDPPDDEGNPMAHWPKPCASAGQGMGPQCGSMYATALSLCMLSYAYEEHWTDESYVQPTAAKCSYGYNNRLGNDRRRPAADTIMVMDYEHWEIDRDDIDVEKNDTEAKIATRHGGRANALCGDGSVRALDIDDITPGMWTPEAGD